uniref:Uncharacterized protein n=1 Tax=Anopheles coluzzii TaxID=1518534 RepID=A0A8W7P359_ANOCL
MSSARQVNDSYSSEDFIPFERRQQSHSSPDFIPLQPEQQPHSSQNIEPLQRPKQHQSHGSPDFIPFHQEQQPHSSRECKPNQRQQQPQTSQDLVPAKRQQQPQSSRHQPPVDDPGNEKYYSITGPRFSNRMVLYMAKYLRGLVGEKKSIRCVLEEYLTTDSSQRKAREALRRQLNTLLLGVYGLREGRTHLNYLRHEMDLCMNADPWKQELPLERRNKIDEAIRYLFTAYDHGDYQTLWKEYEQRCKANELQRLTYYDLGIPRMIFKPKPDKNGKQKKKHKKLNNVDPNYTKGKKKERRRKGRKGKGDYSDDAGNM